MKTIGNSSSYGFGTMLRHELSSSRLWLLAGGILLTTWFVGASGFFGVALLVLLCSGMSLITAHLVHRTPWCSDTAFWRTRPVSRRLLFQVKTLAMLLLCVLPVTLAAVVGMRGVDEATSFAVLALALLGSVGMVVSVASASAIGSLGGRWKSAGWQAVFVAPLLSAALLVVARIYFSIPTPQGPGGGVSALILGLSIAAMGGVTAWVVVGSAGKARAGFWILLGTAFVWPWIGTTFRGDFFSQPKAEGVLLELEEAVSVLRVPGGDEVKVEDEWFVPSYIAMAWRDPAKKDFFSQASFVFSSGGLIHPNSKSEAFSSDQRDFSSVVDVESLWTALRATLPTHEIWIPSERSDRDFHSNFELPPAEAFEAGVAEIDMGGSLFRFHPLSPVSLEMGEIENSLPERLKILDIGIPNDYSIGVDIEMSGSILADGGGRSTPVTVDPPNLWGILFHEESGTAYATASMRMRNSSNGLSKLLFWSDDLHLRFELPRMESALLGLDPKEVVAESKLYLFVVEKLGPASVDSPSVTR